jgi:hypothetical protein
VEFPEHLNALESRSLDEIAAAAQAVQANVVALRVVVCRLTGQEPATHPIKTPAPGAVKALREILIDRPILAGYAVEEAMLRLRQVWGEFCALCWLFPHVDPQRPIHFGEISPWQTMRCLGEVHEKLAEVQRGLWRLLHEQRLRHDPEASRKEAFRRDHEFALSRPMTVAGKLITLASDDEIFCAACEHAGMFAALRWVTDKRWAWEAAGIMTLPTGGVL